MKKLVLHIGANKTGSSALQSGFARYHQEIGNAGFHYPRHANFQNAAEGKFSSGNGNRIRALLVPRLRPDGYDERSELQAIVKEIADAPADCILISNEGLHRAARPLLTAFLAACAEVDIEVHAYYYVRDLLDHAYSSYMQDVKMGRETRAFSDFLEDYQPPFSSACAVFREAMENRFHVRVYEEHKSNLLQGFLDWVDINVGVPVKVGSVNPSIGQDEIFVLRQLNLLQIPPKIRGRIGKNIMDSDFSSEEYIVEIKENLLHEFQERAKIELSTINNHVVGRKARIVSEDLKIVSSLNSRETTSREKALMRLLSVIADELSERRT